MISRQKIIIGGVNRLMEFIHIQPLKPLHYISCGCFVSSEDWVHKKRNIDSNVLIAGLKGTAYIQIENEKYEVTPNSILIMPSGKTHFGYKKSSSSVSYYWCHFNSEDAFKLLNEQEFVKEVLSIKSASLSLNHPDSILLPVFSSYKNTDRIKILFRQLIHTANFNRYTKFEANYLLTALLIEITELAVTNYYDSLKRNINDSKFEEMLEWIRINIDANITAESISQRFNYNPDYLCRIFKQKTGTSIIKYIHELKLSKAKELLICSEESIKEIAYKTGFNDEKYFMKLFKKYEHITPTQYRNAYSYTHLNKH